MGVGEVVSTWAFTYNACDYRYRKELYEALDLVRDIGGMAEISEASSSDPMRWINMLRRGVKGVSPASIYWYTLSHDNGFGILDGTMESVRKPYEKIRGCA